MGVGRGLRVEVEVLNDERTSPPAVFKDLWRCLTIPAVLCSLIVVIGVMRSSTWRASIWLLPLGLSALWCSTQSPVTTVLAAQVVG